MTASESAVIGSGNSHTKEEQMAGLSLKIADEVEEWLAEEHAKNGWFDPRPEPLVDQAEDAAEIAAEG